MHFNADRQPHGLRPPQCRDGRGVRKHVAVPQHPLRAVILSVILLLFLRLPAHGAVLVSEGAAPDERNVTFVLKGYAEARQIAVAGSFNGWDHAALPMTRAADEWRATIPLSAPGTYEYKFVIDGETWITDPDRPETADTAVGSNSLLRIEGDTASGAPSTHGFSIELHTGLDGNAALVWGLDNWHPPGPADMPPGVETITTSTGVYPVTPLARGADGIHRANLHVRTGHVLDFALRIRSAAGETWDNNQERDYHVRMDRAVQFVLVHTPGNGSEGQAQTSNVRLIVLSLLVAVLIAAAWWRWRPEGNRAVIARVAIVLAIGIVAWQARAPRLAQSADDIDELSYVPLARQFADNLRAGDLRSLIDNAEVAEHPRAGLAIYTLAVAATGTQGSHLAARQVARRTAALLACLTAILLALRYPAAGLAWALHGTSIHYTAVAYLDSPMVFFSVVALLAGEQGFADLDGKPRRATAWLALSAAALGAAISTKYLAAPVAFAIAAHISILIARSSNKPRLSALFLAYITLSVFAMVASDWRLWSPDILERIRFRLVFHRQFSTSALVEESGFPWYMPLSYLWGNWFGEPPGWMLPLFDRSVFVLGLLGLWPTFRKAPLWGSAALFVIAFLLVWPTKWPQYVVLAVPPLAVSAHVFLATVASRFFVRAGPPAAADAAV